jgi:hypothetical protein
MPLGAKEKNMRFTIHAKGEAVGILEAVNRGEAEAWLRSHTGRFPAGARVGDDDPLVKAFRGLGLSESQAEEAARGRCGRPLPVYTVQRSSAAGGGSNRLVRAFKLLGLSESEARVAACGREPGGVPIGEDQKRPTDGIPTFEFSESSGRLVYGKK